MVEFRNARADPNEIERLRRPRRAKHLSLRSGAFTMRVAAAARLLTGSPKHLLSYNSESQSIEKPGKLENPSAALVTMKRGPLFCAATAVRLGGFRLPSSLSPAL